MLSRREIEVESLALKGWSGSQIGTELGIKLSTVKMHLASIYQKRGVKNKLGLLVAQKSTVNKHILLSPFINLPIGGQND